MGVVCRSFRGERESVGIEFLDPSLTVQSSREECDINVIVKRALRTGEMPISEQQGIYADISHLSGLREAMDEVREAQEAFMALPAEVRREFDNDPRVLVDFADNPANYERALELKLVKPRVMVQGDAKDPSKRPAPVESKPEASKPAGGGAAQ